MPRAQRYSRILQAAKLYSAVDNLIKSITDSTRKGQNVGNGTARQPSQKLFIDPFNIALAENQVVPATGAAPSWTKYAAAIGNRASATAPANENLIVKIADFTAARVVINTGRSTTGVKKVSKVTGLAYLSYGGKSTSLPFGRNAAADTMAAAFEEIRTRVVAATPGAIVTLTPEKF
jgi:hypothetical protein